MCRIGLMVVVTLGLFGCESQRDSAQTARADWLAKVGAITIGLEDVVRHLKFQQIDTPEGDPVLGDDALLQAEALEALIEEALILEAARAEHMVVSQSDVTQAWDQLRGGWTEEELDIWLSNRDETVESFKASLRNSLLVARYLNERIYARAAVRAEEIEAELERQADVKPKPRVKASQIVVSSLEEAKSILRELRRGLAFDVAATKYSITPEAKQGGQLGWFEPDEMPQLYQQCFNMWPGQLSQVISSEYGYVILKVHERETSRNRSLRPAERAKHIEEQLLNSNRQTLLRAELKRLRTVYSIERRRPTATTDQL